jgi:hypothetical protein
VWFSRTGLDGENEIVRWSGRDRLVVAAFNLVPGHDFDPALTRDGLVMLFLHDDQIREVRRTSVEAEFPAVPSTPQGLQRAGGLDVSPDGLTVYYDDGERLHVITRASLDSVFTGATELGFAGRFPSISPDEREIYYNTQDGIVRRRRASPPEPFGDEEFVIEGATGPLDGFDAEISPDNTRLYFAGADTLWFTTRVCP